MLEFNLQGLSKLYVRCLWVLIMAPYLLKFDFLEIMGCQKTGQLWIIFCITL